MHLEAVNAPRVHVLLYTHNRVSEIGNTIAALRATKYANYKVYLLNNGSTDGTKEYFDSLPPDIFPELEIVHLPINIGSPGARNWLLALPGQDDCEFLAFFDDDVRVRPDWLIKMLEAMIDYPRAGVVGAKVLNHSLPKVVQHSGALLTQAKDWINHVALWSNEPDQGQFDALSERDYLMGCVMLYRMDSIRDVGSFDIQFSPTQFEDVDHHLRLRLKGWKVLLHGGVEAWHQRISGGKQSPGHTANRYKLQMKYSEYQAQQIIDQGAALDFLEKHPWARQR
ncbi:Glycosyltransferase, GT2 family [Desulfonatronum zhilinae]|nr:Glycosyltransferase, GT2 family [Desulfonatronum zhilinae]